ncbi:MAG: peroxiredoxin family protein [Nitrospinota bacterium]
MQPIASHAETEHDIDERSGAETEPHSPNRMNTIILLVAAVILLNAVYSHSVTGKGINDLLEVGDSFSDFSLETLNHGTVGLDYFAGNPAMFFFYADWCPCSHQSIGWIKKAKTDYGAAGLNVMGIGIQDKEKNLERFAKGYKLSFPVAVKNGESLARSVGVKTTPTTFFVGPDGVIQSISVGKIEKYEQIAEGLGSIMRSSVGISVPEAAGPVSG